MKPLLAVTLAVGLASARKNCAEDKGSWYCEAAQRISYKNVGVKGSYDRVVSMDIANDNCEFEKQAFSGPLAPFDEDVSIMLQFYKVFSSANVINSFHFTFVVHSF
jgi:hypothetical protein